MDRICRSRGGRRHPIPAEKVSKCPTPLGSLSRVVAKISRSVDKDSMAGFVLANGSMSSNQSGEGDIRRALIEADFVDCMVALPGKLFYSVVKRFVPCRMIHWIKRLNILGSFAEIRSQGAHISASLEIQMPFSPVIAAQLS